MIRNDDCHMGQAYGGYDYGYGDHCKARKAGILFLFLRGGFLLAYGFLEVSFT